MRQLTTTEVNQIDGAFKLHFNPFQIIGAIAVGAVTGGPFGIGVAVSIAIIAQGSGNLADMAIDEWGNPR